LQGGGDDLLVAVPKLPYRGRDILREKKKEGWAAIALKAAWRFEKDRQGCKEGGYPKEARRGGGRTFFHQKKIECQHGTFADVKGRQKGLRKEGGVNLVEPGLKKAG